MLDKYLVCQIFGGGQGTPPNFMSCDLGVNTARQAVLFLTLCRQEIQGLEVG